MQNNNFADRVVLLSFVYLHQIAAVYVYFVYKNVTRKTNLSANFLIMER